MASMIGGAESLLRLIRSAIAIKKRGQFRALLWKHVLAAPFDQT